MDSRRLTEERLADAVSEFVDLVNAGSAPEVDTFLEQHADIANRLRPLLETAIRFADSVAAIQPVSADTAVFNTVLARVAAEKRLALDGAVEGGTDRIAITRRSDVFLLLLLAFGGVLSKTRLVKLSFLTGKETNASTLVPDYFKHFAYDYEFDDAICHDISALSACGLVETEQPSTPELRGRQLEALCRLTPRGRMYAEALARAEDSAPGVVDDLTSIAKRYGRLSLDELLRYVHENYPEYTSESVIRSKVVGKRGPEKKA